MSEFLSPAWIEELDATARASAALTAFTDRLVIEQHVTGVPGGDVRYHVVLGDGTARVRAGAAADPDVVIVTDQPTARAIHDGSENAQGALASGRMDVRGDLEKVREYSDALASLPDLFAPMRAATGLPELEPPRQ
jgi:hypothetical protein